MLSVTLLLIFGVIFHETESKDKQLIKIKLNYNSTGLQTKLNQIDANVANAVDRLTKSMEKIDARLSALENIHPYITCSAVKKATPSAKSGVYRLEQRPHLPFDGYCQFDDDGNWLVLMRRQDGTTRFSDRSWIEYKHGFGSMTRNFWLGNELMHQITSRLVARPLKIVMRGPAVASKNIPAATKYAQYSTFHIGSEEQKYKLTIGGFTGDVYTDAMAYHNGMRFSTVDADNDASSGNCAQYYEGAWWYNGCQHVQLTGKYHTPGYHDGNYVGMNWYQWGAPISGVEWYYYMLEYAEMKIKF